MKKKSGDRDKRRPGGRALDRLRQFQRARGLPRVGPKTPAGSDDEPREVDEPNEPNPADETEKESEDAETGDQDEEAPEH